MDLVWVCFELELFHIHLQGFYCNQYTHTDARNLPCFYTEGSSGLPSEDAMDGESTGPLFWYMYNHYQSVKKCPSLTDKGLLLFFSFKKCTTNINLFAQKLPVPAMYCTVSMYCGWSIVLWCVCYMSDLIAGCFRFNLGWFSVECQPVFKKFHLKSNLNCNMYMFKL